MAQQVDIIPPGLPEVPSMANGMPVSGSQLDAFGRHLAHLLGAQLTQVAWQGFGKQEIPLGAGVTTLRYRHRAGQNCRAIVAALLCGYTTGSGPGEAKLNGAETRETLPVEQTASVLTWAEQQQFCVWVKPVTPGALNEHVFELTDTRPHSIVIYEVPLSLLRDLEYHVDRTVGDISRYITDDAVASNPRGFKRLLSGVQDARREMRRHLINCAWPYTATPTGGISKNSGYLFGSATAGDGLRIRPRDVIGDGATEMPAKISFYVAAVGASTFTLTISDGAAGSPYTIAGINATGWTAEADIEALFDLDTVKVEITRTAGAGSMRIVSTCCYEDAP